MNLTKITFFVVFMAIYVCSSAFGQTNNNNECAFQFDVPQAQDNKFNFGLEKLGQLDHLARWDLLVPKEYVANLEFVNVMIMKLNDYETLFKNLKVL